MTVFPVIARELRASARQPFTYYLRVLGVTALLVASLLFGLHLGFAPALGQELFAALHRALLGAIWVLVPMLTADCISRERREGTLGLLFLTPLTGMDIVMAKGVAQALRAITLGLAVLPVLTIPFLLGGVSWFDASLSVLLNGNAMCWALAAGLLASAWSKSWLRALLVAALLAFAFLLLLGAGAGWFLLEILFVPLGVVPYETTLGVNWSQALAAGFHLFTNYDEEWSAYVQWRALRPLGWALGQMTLLSLLVLLSTVLATGARTRRSWQEEPLSPRQIWLRQTFCTPLFWVAFLRRWMRRSLERNPIGWLEQRTWSGRLVTWGWFAALISIYIVVLTDRDFVDDCNVLHQRMAWLLAGSMAMSAAGSFRRERESGVLELLLVSPLGESQIISGRLRGLWGQFLPTVGLLLAVWLYLSGFLPYGSGAGVIVFFAVTFLSVPAFGLYFSLRCRNFITAFLSTVTVGLLLPLVLPDLAKAMWLTYAFSDPRFSWDMQPSLAAAVCQGLLAGFCWHRLYRRLKKRTFPLQRVEIH